MSILRTRLLTRTPPPSPIANAKGLKSAAINDEILAEYLQKNLQIPDLTLPQSYFLSHDHPHRHHIPVEIDFSALKSRDNDSIRQLVESAAKLGLFRLIGHGISADQLQSTISDADFVFRISSDKQKTKRNLKMFNLGSKNVTRQEFFWFRSGNEIDVTLREQIGNDKYRILSRKMDDIYDKLEEIAENVGQILFEYINKKPELEKKRNNKERESVLCYYKFSKTNNIHEHDDNSGQELFDVDEKKSLTSSRFHALSLYLYVGDQKFHVNTEKGLLSCKACSGTIVVTIKKQLEEWSQGKLKCVTGEPIVDRNIHVNPSYAIEFMFSPSSSNLNYTSNNNMIKSISIFDQIIIIIFIALLYSFFSYISSTPLK